MTARPRAGSGRAVPAGRSRPPRAAAGPSATARSASPAPTRPSRSPSSGCWPMAWPWSIPGGRGGSQRRPGAGSGGRHNSRARQGSHRRRGEMTRWDGRTVRLGAARDGIAVPVPVRGHDRHQAVLEEVRASTVAKIAEITELRQAIAARDAGAAGPVRRPMAARFAAGGRLLAFGNGGSATDAQELATLFLDPGPGEPAAAGVLPGQRHRGGHRAVQRRRRRGGVRPPDRRVRRAGTTSPSACPPAATPRTCCAPWTRRPGGGCSPSGIAGLRRREDGRAGQSSITCSSRRPRPCTGSRRRRPRSTTCCGS